MTGSLDNGFGNAGVLEYKLTLAPDEIRDVVVDASGFYLLGYTTGIDASWRVEKRLK